MPTADPALKELHGHNGGVRWRLVPDGVFVEGTGLERTSGEPITVTRVWEAYHVPINTWARHYGVYCELIVATICTESSGRADARRCEPGYESDATTPSKVSLGLMQTLISTAREALGKPDIDTAWLLDPGNAIRAGTAYIERQAGATRLDPPKVACAYNAGGVYDNDGDRNRWKMRQFPIGTGDHCDRFVKWFNDAVAILKSHASVPSLSLASFLGI